MAKYQLTWMQGITPRWRKIYEGKPYYFPGAPTKALSYRAALEEWAKLKEQLDQQADPHKAKRAVLIREITQEAANDPSGDFKTALAEIAGVAIPLPGSDKPLLQPLVDSFLAEKRQDELSAGRYDNIRRALEHFAGWHGERLAIDGNTIPDYRTHCLNRSARYAAEKLACLKQFLRWCWEREVIDQLPRTFKASVKVTNGKPKIWDVATFRKIYLAAPERLKLYLLLMVNCGMYSGDISDLHPSEVYWEMGAIHRTRSKTPDNEPTTWKLWPETLKLLKKFRSKGERVLLTRTGKPLNVDALREDGRRSRCDSIRQDFVRWCKRNGYPTPPVLKELRKTGASTIVRQFGDATAIEYLGHAGRTVAQKHYLAITLDDALDWLRKELLADV